MKHIGIAVETIHTGDYVVSDADGLLRKWKEGEELNEEQKQTQEDWKNQTGIFK